MAISVGIPQEDEGQTPLVPASRLHEVEKLRVDLRKIRIRRENLEKSSSTVAVTVSEYNRLIVGPGMLEPEEAEIFTATIVSIAETHLKRLEQQIVDRLKRLQIDPDA